MIQVSIRGKIVNGRIELTAPMPLPDGTDVSVTMTPLPPTPEPEHVEPPVGPFSSDPAIGLWADREDMGDTVEWVNEQRKSWWGRRTDRD